MKGGDLINSGPVIIARPEVLALFNVGHAGAGLFTPGQMDDQKIALELQARRLAGHILRQGEVQQKTAVLTREAVIMLVLVVLLEFAAVLSKYGQQIAVHHRDDLIVPDIGQVCCHQVFVRTFKKVTGRV